MSDSNTSSIVQEPQAIQRPPMTRSSNSTVRTVGSFLGPTPSSGMSSAVPFLQAAAIYQREPCARTFQQDLEWHFRFGYVLSTPECFVMGRGVRHDADHSDIVCPAVRFKTPDCWHIYLLAGSMEAAWLLMPFRLRWMSFERNNILRIYETDKLRRHFKLP